MQEKTEDDFLKPIVESMQRRTEQKPLIFVDTRERNTDAAQELARHECTIKEKLLVVGDYLCSDRVAVERKTADDFVSSIIDGRLFQQAKLLKNNFDRPVLLVEGNDLYSRIRNPNMVRGAFASIAVDFQLPLIWSRDARESAGLIFWLAKREQFDEKREIGVRGEKKAESAEERQEFLVSGLPGVNIVRARALLKHFENPLAVFSAGPEELQKVEGIGEKTAESVREILEKKYKK